MFGIAVQIWWPKPRRERERIKREWSSLRERELYLTIRSWSWIGWEAEAKGAREWFWNIPIIQEHLTAKSTRQQQCCNRARSSFPKACVHVLSVNLRNNLLHLNQICCFWSWSKFNEICFTCWYIGRANSYQKRSYAQGESKRYVNITEELLLWSSRSISTIIEWLSFLLILSFSCWSID